MFVSIQHLGRPINVKLLAVGVSRIRRAQIKVCDRGEECVRIYQPLCSMIPVTRTPSCTVVLSISGMGFSSNIPSSSPSTGKLTLIALHLAVNISTPRQLFDR